MFTNNDYLWYHDSMDWKPRFQSTKPKIDFKKEEEKYINETPEAVEVKSDSDNPQAPPVVVCEDGPGVEVPVVLSDVQVQ